MRGLTLSTATEDPRSPPSFQYAEGARIPSDPIWLMRIAGLGSTSRERGSTAQAALPSPTLRRVNHVCE